MVQGRASRIEFCCLAFPLINVGSYTICLEFIFVALCTIILAVAPPQIVATMGALPSGFPKIIVAVVAVVVLLWQFVGMTSIKRERSGLYRTYIRVNFLLVLLMLVVTLAFFAVAAARHSTALTACTAAYGSQPQGSSTMSASALQDLGSKICNIFIWVQVGFMGLLIATIGLTQLYMCALQRAYGKEMRRAEQDRKMYDGTGADEIPLATRGSGIWEAPNTAATNGFGSGAVYGGGMQNSSDDDHYGGAAAAPQRRSYLSPSHDDAQYNYPSYATYGANQQQQQYGGGGDEYDHRRGESKHSAHYYAS